MSYKELTDADQEAIFRAMRDETFESYLAARRSVRAAKVVAEFPGLTQKALFSLHGIEMGTLYRCVDLGLVIAKECKVGHRSGHIDVWRFYPNPSNNKNVVVGDKKALRKLFWKHIFGV